MGRIRSIKPEFPQSESMGKVSREARLCFILLWTICDDSGRTRGASRMLASLLYPYDEDAPSLIDGWLSDLESQGCIQRYEVDGSRYIQICKWQSHQKIDKPSKSKFPPFANPREGSPRAREDSSGDQGGDQGVDQGVEGSLSDTTLKRNAKDETRSLLLAQGLPSMDTAIVEWGKMAQGRARCRDLDAVLEFIGWCIDRGLKDGKAIQYARDCQIYADEWAQKGAA